MPVDYSQDFVTDWRGEAIFVLFQPLGNVDDTNVRALRRFFIATRRAALYASILRHFHASREDGFKGRKTRVARKNSRMKTTTRRLARSLHTNTEGIATQSFCTALSDRSRVSDVKNRRSSEASSSHAPHTKNCTQTLCTAEVLRHAHCAHCT